MELSIVSRRTYTDKGIQKVQGYPVGSVVIEDDEIIRVVLGINPNCEIAAFEDFEYLSEDRRRRFNLLATKHYVRDDGQPDVTTLPIGRIRVTPSSVWMDLCMFPEVDFQIIDPDEILKNI